MKTNLTQLRERIERNYTKFKNLILTLDPEDIYALSKRITAVKDTCDFVTETDIIDEDDAEYLLGYKNPLETLAMAWEEYLETETGGDFAIMSYDLLENDEFDDDCEDDGEDELYEMIEDARREGKICALCQLKAMLDELFDECETCGDRGLGIGR